MVTIKHHETYVVMHGEKSWHELVRNLEEGTTKPWRNAAYLTAAQILLRKIRTTCPGVILVPVGWTLPHHSLEGEQGIKNHDK